MQFISTRGRAAALGFSDAVLAGLASDGGLYVPQTWPQLTAAEIATLDEVSAERPQYPHWMRVRNNSTRFYSGEPVKMGGIPPSKV